MTFANLYALLKRTHNQLHPQTTPRGFAIRGESGFYGTFTFTNPEATPFTLDLQRFLPVYSNESKIGSLSPLQNINPITVPSKQITTLSILATFLQGPKECVGFTVYYFGEHQASGASVRISGHFDLDPQQKVHPQKPAWSQVSSGILNSIQNVLANRRLTGISQAQLLGLNDPSLKPFVAGRAGLSNEIIWH